MEDPESLEFAIDNFREMMGFCSGKFKHQGS